MDSVAWLLKQYGSSITRGIQYAVYAESRLSLHREYLRADAFLLLLKLIKLCEGFLVAQESGEELQIEDVLD
jgi:hypothetical protein